MRASLKKEGFTLIELLVVVTVIAILVGITIGTLGSVQKNAARGRATAEIAAIETALERYKVDNGDYPAAESSGITGDVYAGNPSDYIGSNATIDPNGQITEGSGGRRLFAELMGRTQFNAAPNANRVPYLELKQGQVGGTKSGDDLTNCYIQDPFGYAYGYFYRPAGLSLATPNRRSLQNEVVPDIWSTGGETGTVNFTNTTSTEYGRYQKWITNWNKP
jgi:prepilin-type N-terminal cleavage/methylation domain-containing protein